MDKEPTAPHSVARHINKANSFRNKEFRDATKKVRFRCKLNKAQSIVEQSLCIKTILEQRGIGRGVMVLHNRQS